MLPITVLIPTTLLPTALIPANPLLSTASLLINTFLPQEASEPKITIEGFEEFEVKWLLRWIYGLRKYFVHIFE